jgi:hypothetical protein
MIEKIKLSLWDILTFFITGVLILILIKYYGFFNKYESVFGASDIFNGIYYLIITYTIGVIYEPLSNLIFKFVFSKLYSKLLWCGYFKKQLYERDEVYLPLVKKIIKDKFNLDGEKIDYYQIAKLSVLQNGKPNTFMTFLSRYGFYRNLTSLAFFNFFLFVIFKFDSLNIFCSIFILLFIALFHLLLYYRAKDFYYYAGNEVYRNFIINNSND